jgi:hypothetical protein
MNRKRKAAMMRVCAVPLCGDRLYKAGQKWFGWLGVRSISRLRVQAEMWRRLKDVGMTVEELHLSEVEVGMCGCAYRVFSGVSQAG